MNFLSSFLLIFLVQTKWKGLFMADEDKIELVRKMSQTKTIILSGIVIGILLLVQRQLFGKFGEAPFEGASMVLYILIFFGLFEGISCSFLKETYISFVLSIRKIFPPTFKLLALGECGFFAYLIIKPLLNWF